MQGTREWKNYQAEADITPWLMDAGGIAVRVQGLKRFYALQLVKGNKIRLLKALDQDTILGERDFEWKIHHTYCEYTITCFTLVQYAALILFSGKPQHLINCPDCKLESE